MIPADTAAKPTKILSLLSSEHKGEIPTRDYTIGWTAAAVGLASNAISAAIDVLAVVHREVGSVFRRRPVVPFEPRCSLR